MKLLVRWLASAIALIAVSYLVPGVVVAGFGAALVAALVIGLVNATLGAVVKFFTTPLRWLTLGLLTLVINAGLFWLATEIVDGVEVTGVVPALVGSLAYGLIAAVIQSVVGVRGE
ncbi:phage holin family protein [Rubrivirga sp.]|uniref:phage holin family protein n=1 Tax=Rubrivirga sp. TaxID=1885344 RepID=UPI003B52A349